MILKDAGVCLDAHKMILNSNFAALVQNKLPRMPVISSHIVLSCILLNRHDV